MVAASRENAAISLWYVRFVVLPLLLLVCATTVLAQSQNEPSDASLEGRRILSIVADPPQQPLLGPEFDDRLGLHIGAPLALADVRRAIDSLYQTGRYHDISIEAEPSADGVNLRVVTTFNYFISAVNIEGGADPPSLEQLRTATKLELGVQFDPSMMEPAVDNLLERLRANGLYRADVEYHVD